MSAQTSLMKNLIDMGIVENESNNTISTSIKSDDNNYIINLKRKPRLSFLSEESSSSFNCTIEITTILNVPVLSIYTTELEISKLIDVFYNLVENNIGKETYYYFNPIDSTCIPRIFSLSKLEKEYNFNQFKLPYTQVSDDEYIFSIFDKIDERLIKRITIKFNYGSIIELLEKFYYTFLIDIDLDNTTY